MRDETAPAGGWPGRMAILAVLITIELSAVAALHRLGRLPGLTVDWRHPSAWVTASAAEDVLAATLRLVALACAYWLLLSTTLYVAARLAHLPGAVRAIGWATLPAMRGLADRALAVTLVGSTVTSWAGVAWASAEVPFEAPLVVLGVEEPTLPPGVQPPPPPTLEVPCSQPLADWSDIELPPATTPPTDVASPPVLVPLTTGGLLIPPSPQPSLELDTTLGPAEELYEVVKGDNLWRIAASTLRRLHRDGKVTDGDIAAYWRGVIDANRHLLRSGSPNLIFPGEQIVLPPSPGKRPASPTRP